MRSTVVVWLLLYIAVANGMAANLEYDVTSLGGDDYRYSYNLTGFTLASNQEIDIRFDPSLFGLLSNAVAPPEFDVLVLQPDNPPGAFGDLGLLALINNPSMDGIFTIDVRFLGTGLPGSQPFFINGYSVDGSLLISTPGGRTTDSIPEPATALLVGTSFAAMCLHVRRRRAS